MLEKTASAMPLLQPTDSSGELLLLHQSIDGKGDAHDEHREDEVDDCIDSASATPGIDLQSDDAAFPYDVQLDLALGRDPIFDAVLPRKHL